MAEWIWRVFVAAFIAVDVVVVALLVLPIILGVS